MLPLPSTLPHTEGMTQRCPHCDVPVVGSMEKHIALTAQCAASELYAMFWSDTHP